MNHGLRGGVAVLLSLLVVSVARRAPACSLANAPDSSIVVSPAAGTVLGVDSALLLRTRLVAPAVVLGVGTDSVELVPAAAFESLYPVAPPWTFFRPASPLTPGHYYELDVTGGALAVPFYVVATAPRVDATLVVSVAPRTVPEHSLESASCYDGALRGRPFTRLAEVVVTSRPATRLLVSVTTLDSVSGELIQDTALHDERAESARIELPMPAGVAECLRVQVLDYAGTLLADEGSFCLTPEGEARSRAAQVFVPTDAPPRAPSDPGFITDSTVMNDGSPAEPPGAGRTSKGCGLSSRTEERPITLGLLALGWLGLRRRLEWSRPICKTSRHGQGA